MWLTHIGEIVHQDDLLEQVGRGSVQHRVHRPEEYRPRLVVETDDNWRGRKILQVTTRLLAPATEHLDETVFTPNPSTRNRTSGWHRVHTESSHQQQNLWVTMCSHRILPPATESLGATVFTSNPPTSNRTSGWHRVHTESSQSNRTSPWHHVQAEFFHLQYNTGSSRVVRLWDELLKPRVFIFSTTKTLFSPTDFSDRFWHPHILLLNWAGDSFHGSTAALL